MMLKWALSDTLSMVVLQTNVRLSHSIMVYILVWWQLYELRCHVSIVWLVVCALLSVTPTRWVNLKTHKCSLRFEPSTLQVKTKIETRFGIQICVFVCLSYCGEWKDRHPYEGGEPGEVSYVVDSLSGRVLTGGWHYLSCQVDTTCILWERTPMNHDTCQFRCIGSLRG